MRAIRRHDVCSTLQLVVSHMHGYALFIPGVEEENQFTCNWPAACAAAAARRNAHSIRPVRDWKRVGFCVADYLIRMRYVWYCHHSL